jgi:hypothetical protein
VAGRIYTVPYTGTLTNAGGNADLFEFVPGDDKPIALRGLILGQTSEVADAAEEAISVSIIHLAATVTSGNGTGVTPVPIDVLGNPTAAGFTAEANGATVATSSGTSTTVVEFAWNLRGSPYELWFPDERFAPKCRQASGLVVRCNTTVADDVTICITAFVEED